MDVHQENVRLKDLLQQIKNVDAEEIDRCVLGLLL